MSPLEVRSLPRQELPAVEEYSLQHEPYYLSIADEVDVFLAAYEARLPVLVKGPHWLWENAFRGIHGLSALSLPSACRRRAPGGGDAVDYGGVS